MTPMTSSVMETSSMRMFTTVTAMMTAIGQFCDVVPAVGKECTVDILHISVHLWISCMTLVYRITHLNLK